MHYISAINSFIGIAFTICYFYQILYIFVPFLRKDRSRGAGRRHRFAILISARNEANVIANLLESIKGQTYPQELLEVFVVADNCTDNTADIAASCGAHVFKRFDDVKIGKGYALNYLLHEIFSKYGKNYFDGYMVFDADNVLDSKYIDEMNRTFSSGYEILTSYRNSKNYGDSWVSAGYGLWFLRESKYLNYPRMLLGSSCAISGTGFMFSKKVAQELDGWWYYLLTEDIEFSIDHILKGYQIGFCKDAIFFDEQPTKFNQSVRQRMRWAKGYFQVLCHYGVKLIKGISKGSFACFDMTMNIMPALFLTLALIVINTTAAITGFVMDVDISPIFSGLFESLGNMYGTMLMIGTVTTITEWKNIYATPFKKVLYAFTFPVFMMSYIPVTIVALFKKVEWKPIVHSRSKSLADIKSAN